MVILAWLDLLYMYNCGLKTLTMHAAATPRKNLEIWTFYNAFPALWSKN